MAIALLFVSGGSLAAFGQSLLPTWNQLTPPTNPGTRYIHSMAYDATNHNVVMFGGFGSSGYLDETWLWDGTSWTQAHPAHSPSPRAASLMAYDATNGNVVLFGGFVDGSTRYADTWLWNGNDWSPASPGTSPPARSSGAMVYDAAHGNVVLFGGTNGSTLGDTWIWDGTNWTQRSPQASPSPRADSGVAYDATHGYVILFGGEDGSQHDQQDTWTWDGNTWTQQNVSLQSAPPARDAQGMAYNAATGQVVMFGGRSVELNSAPTTYSNDTWVWNGTFWAEVTWPGVAPSPRLVPREMVYDAARSQVVLFGGYSSNGQFNDTFVWGLPTNFGNANVCPSGQSTPTPCAKTLTLAYSFPTGGTLASVNVVTQGVPNLDFTLSSQGTCAGITTIPASSTCTEDITFTPRAAGLRTGAVQLFDSNNQLIASTPISGIGQAPVAAFWPVPQSTLNTGNFGLTSPKGLITDDAGNLYIANTGSNDNSPTHTILKIASDGAETLLAAGWKYPQGMAVDGAGNLFVADNDLNQVLKLPAGCTTSACQIVIDSTYRAQLGVAVDNMGDVFFDDFLDGEVVKVAANSGVKTVIYSPGSGSNPVGLGTNPAGDLFIADYGLQKVVKISAGCTTSSCQTPVGSGWVRPESVSVDAAGNLYVADFGLGKVLELPVGCADVNCAITLATGTSLFDAAVDQAGIVYVADALNNQVYKIDRSQPSPLAFPSTDVGSASAAQAVTLQNVGNQLLTSALVVNGPNFAETSGAGAPADCTSSFSLVRGAECKLSVRFTPQTIGNPLTSTAVFSDNSFNVASAVQTLALSGIGTQSVPTFVTVPDLTGQTQAGAGATLTSRGLLLLIGGSAFSDTVPAGSVASQNPAAGAQVAPNTQVSVTLSSGPTPVPNPLSLQNNYFVTGDYAAAGITLRGTGQNGVATGTINIPSGTQSGVAVPDGADILDAYLYWEAVESTPSPSGASGTFRGYPIVGQQIGSDQPYTDGAFSGTLRVYRADVNAYLPAQANGIRYASGAHIVTLPDSGAHGFPLSEGASLVVIYRVLAQNFPLKSVVLYDGSAVPTTSTGPIAQAMQGFYDAAGGANASGVFTGLFAAGGQWNSTPASVGLGSSDHFNTSLNPGNAYAALILSTLVNNSDNDGILDAWKTGSATEPLKGPGYYDVKTGFWVDLPGAAHGQKDLFVQMDWMCGTVNADGTCSGENLFPSPDAQGHDPLAMVTQAFANHGIHLHLDVENAIPEDTCNDSGSQLCQFPGAPGVISWKNSLEIAKLWPRNFIGCATGGDCSTRFAYGRKDSYHYVLFGHSLAIPAWNSRFGTLTAITVSGGTTTITTSDRGSGLNKCPGRVTISGVLGNPTLNGIYNTTGCSDSKTIGIATPGVPDWTYPNLNLPEPVIGLTSGNISSISGYSDLGGADSAVTLGLWLTAPNQDMSKKASVIAGTMFHEIGHTLGLTHGGLYYDTAGSYVPTFEANCKPNYQSSMNYLFQLDGVGPNHAVDFSSQTLGSLNESSAGGTTTLSTAVGNQPAAYPTSAWYVPYSAGALASPATLHCDGTPLNGAQAYRVDAPINPITPAWSNGQDINFDGQPNAQMRGYSDWDNIDLRQVAATGGQFASLATVLSFGASATPLDIAAGGNVTLGSGGTITLGSGGNITLGSGGNVTLGSGGTITLGSGGNITLGSGGTITLGSGGSILDGGKTTMVPASGGTFTVGAGGVITLGSGGNITLGSGGNVTLGSGGTITLGSGGNITLGSGGNITLGSGGTVTLGSGGVGAGSGGNVTLGSGGNVTLGSGGTVTLGSGGNVTLGSGGNVTLGSGGTITLGSGGNVTLGSGGNVTLGSGGTITLGSGGTVIFGSAGSFTSGGTTIQVPAGGGTYTIAAGGNITLGSGGNVTLGSGGNVTLGSGGNITLGSGGNVTLGSGGNITLGSGGTITLGSGGNVTLGSGGVVTLGSGGNITLGSGGNVTLGSGGNVTLGSGGVTTTELTYETANSIVRPPAAPSYTPMGTTSVRVDWTAPAFGVVQTYTIFRSSDGAVPIEIGSVSGIGGAPPATTFTDTNPDLTATIVVYTITTTLVPDAGTSTERQSPQSEPAVMKNDQTVVLGPLPSSVPLSNAQTNVTATAQTGGIANKLQVNFSATGSCTISGQSVDSTSGISSAVVALNTAGSCNITAAQLGSNDYNAADPVSGTFQILPQGSNLQSQTITFPQIPDAQYGGSFTLSASSSAALPITFSTSGPCTTAGRITGVGVCTLTASQAGNSTYSATKVSQAFTIHPAVLTVAADSLTIAHGQAIPTLTYKIAGFVNGEPASVVSGLPALSTTATSSSVTGVYPITVTTGSLAATNYSFLYVGGTVTITGLTQTITFTKAPPASAAYGTTFTVTATGGASGNPVTFMSAGACTNSAATYTMIAGTGTCSIIANQAGDGSYAAAPTVTKIVSAIGPIATVSPSSIDFGTVHLASITTKNIKVTNSGTAPLIVHDPILSIVKGGTSNEFVAVNLCVLPLAPGKSCTITIAFIAGPIYTPQSATLYITDNAPGSPQPVALTANVINPLVLYSPINLGFGTVKHSNSSTLNVTLSNPGATPLIFSGISITGANKTSFSQTNTCGASLASGAKCTVSVKFSPATTGTFNASLALTDNALLGGGTQTISLTGKGN